MVVVDLNSRKLAEHFTALAQCREAQATLDTAGQYRQASHVIAALDEPRTFAEAKILADALRHAVDALCNVGATTQARLEAERVNEALNAATPQRWSPVLRSKSPRTLEAVRAGVVLAHAIELDGDPDEAISRCVALERQLDRHPEMGDTRQERVRALRGVLSAAKRSGGRFADAFAERARECGDALADEVAGHDRATAFSYWHRAACHARARGSSTAAVDRAIAMYTRSEALRPLTLRSRQTRGMAVGELHVLRGDVEAGARVMSSAVESFVGVLPRHERSARQQLLERELLRAA